MFHLKCSRDIDYGIVTVIVSLNLSIVPSESFSSAVVNRSICHVLGRLPWDKEQSQMVILNRVTQIIYSASYSATATSVHLMWFVAMTSCGWKKQPWHFFYSRGLTVVHSVCKSNKAAPLTEPSVRSITLPCGKLQLITIYAQQK